jgi:pimeloyl-ACP methyl ester carboxylesterase
MVTISLRGRELQLETQWIAPERADARLIVFLHEGLGSISMWGDWPQRLCDATGCRGLVYSRYGYGRSTRRTMNAGWPADFLEQEAREALPALLHALGISPRGEKPVLFGHSDGASIALLYAAAFPEATSGIIVLAPHVYMEDVGFSRIRKLRQSYGTATPLHDLLTQHQSDPDAVFLGWSNCWLTSDMQHWDITALLPRITCPVLAIQGEQDQYATLSQLDDIKTAIPHAELAKLSNCRHVPHQEKPEAVLEASCHFLASL